MEASLTSKNCRTLKTALPHQAKAAVLRAADTAITNVRNTQRNNFHGGLDPVTEDQKDAMGDLIDPPKQVTSFANAMGESFKASFKGLIDGSMTGKQAGRFFSSIADYFADMAAQIAAEAAKLAALEFIKFIFSSFSIQLLTVALVLCQKRTPPTTMPDSGV